MCNISQQELDLISNKILEDYDNKNPSIIFKDKIKITNQDALIIQSNVARLREKRGEEVIGYKIGCVSKDTQKKMGFIQPASGYLWKSELHYSGAILKKKDYTNPAMEAEFGIILNSDLKPELDNFDYTKEQSEEGYKNFTVIQCKIKSIEWLYLAAKGHRRARFDLENNKDNWLVP